MPTIQHQSNLEAVSIYGSTIDSYGGGIVFYLDNKGGGLIAAASDHASRVPWGGAGTSISGADGIAVVTGAQNTQDIVTALGNNDGNNYSVNVNGTIYDDWFLPSRDELNEMYKNQDRIGGFVGKIYSSSSEASEDSSNYAWLQFFNIGFQSDGGGKQYIVLPKL